MVFTNFILLSHSLKISKFFSAFMVVSTVLKTYKSLKKFQSPLESFLCFGVLQCGKSFLAFFKHKLFDLRLVSPKLYVLKIRIDIIKPKLEIYQKLYDF